MVPRRPTNAGAPASAATNILLLFILVSAAVSTNARSVTTTSSTIKDKVNCSWLDAEAGDWWGFYKKSTLDELGLEEIGANGAAVSNYFTEAESFADVDGTLWSYVGGSQNGYPDEIDRVGSVSFTIDRPGDYVFVYFCCDDYAVSVWRNVSVEPPDFPIFNTRPSPFISMTEIEINVPLGSQDWSSSHGVANFDSGLDWIWVLDTSGKEGDVTDPAWFWEMFQPNSIHDAKATIDLVGSSEACWFYVGQQEDFVFGQTLSCTNAMGAVTATSTLDKSRFRGYSRFNLFFPKGGRYNVMLFAGDEYKLWAPMFSVDVSVCALGIKEANGNRSTVTAGEPWRALVELGPGCAESSGTRFKIRTLPSVHFKSKWHHTTKSEVSFIASNLLAEDLAIYIPLAGKYQLVVEHLDTETALSDPFDVEVVSGESVAATTMLDCKGIKSNNLKTNTQYVCVVSTSDQFGNKISADERREEGAFELSVIPLSGLALELLPGSGSGVETMGRPRTVSEVSIGRTPPLGAEMYAQWYKGVYYLNFTLPRGGRWSLRVKLRNQLLFGSPLDLYVQDAGACIVSDYEVRFVESCDATHMWGGSASAFFEKMSDCTGGFVPAEMYLNYSCSYVPRDSKAGTTALGVFLVSAVVVGLVVSWLQINRKYPIVRATNPIFIQLFGFGCIMVNAYGYVFGVGKPTDGFVNGHLFRFFANT